jgi:hypothetical protein
MLADPYATNVLNPAVHGRLVADIETYAADARIQPEAIWTPLAKVCGEAEIEYVKRFKFHRAADIAGMVYVGKSNDLDIDGRMHAVAGALIRNFIRARVMVMSQLFDAIEEEGIPDVSALLLPNFHVPAANGGSKASWKLANILDVLMHRRAIGVQTIVYTPDLDQVGLEYGSGVRRLLMQNYVRVKV